MDGGNKTSVTKFLLVGFQHLKNFRIFVFIILLVIYIMIIAGNILIITLVSINKKLFSPMYFMLKHLSISDILLATNIIPNSLYAIMANESFMGTGNCISQLYIFGASSITECCLLTVMSYDRYIAICKPLHYINIMDSNVCLHLVLWSWILGFVLSIPLGLLVSQMQFCGSNVFDHFFCDLVPILELSCSDTFILEIITSLVALHIGVFQIAFIIVTYIYITIAILNISSITGRNKAFSTCSAHLTVVCTYYGTLITTYIVPSQGQSRNVRKIISLLYTVWTPLFNPIIYSFRSQEIREFFKKFVYMNTSSKTNIKCL
ncbi:olfactory receptor 6C3-like [Bombina bombina]|uniref:olfactory receptor 6C3-like n=1 Tax=Bombina bombina TaxID=8345 RepID=UPI00235A89B0|nr:olfactory receptor 6C3-like [Bombina bombina]